MGRNTFLPERERSGFETPPVRDPMDGFFGLWRALDIHRPLSNFMNYNVRGQFVTVYMRIEPLLYHINLLHSRHYTCEMTKQWAIDRGYPETDYYCRVGPYQVRLAQYHEKGEKL